jgi:hypothetical protein
MIEWFLPARPNQDTLFPDNATIMASLEALVTASTPEELYRVLEEQQEVLCSDKALVILLLTIARDYLVEEAEQFEDLQEYLCLLEDVRINGLTMAYERLTTDTDRFRVPPTRLVLFLTNAIAEIEAAEHPQLWAELHSERGFCHTVMAQEGEKAEHIEEAIADFNFALSIFTEEQAPLLWASHLKHRAIAYTERPYGMREENLKQAIADNNAALTTFTIETVPNEYREIQTNLINIYIELRQQPAIEHALGELR